MAVLSNKVLFKRRAAGGSSVAPLASPTFTGTLTVPTLSATTITGNMDFGTI